MYSSTGARYSTTGVGAWTTLRARVQGTPPQALALGSLLAGEIFTTTDEAWITAGADAIYSTGEAWITAGADAKKIHRRGLDHCWRGCKETPPLALPTGSPLTRVQGTPSQALAIGSLWARVRCTPPGAPRRFPQRTIKIRLHFSICCCWLLVVGCWLLVGGWWLLVGCWLWFFMLKEYLLLDGLTLAIFFIDFSSVKCVFLFHVQ